MSEEKDSSEEVGQHDHDFYLGVIRDIIEGQKDYLGEDVALINARKAPLEIDRNGDVKDFYGKGPDALETLVDQFEDVWGEEVAHRKVRHTLEGSVGQEKYSLLPEYMRPQENDKGFFGQIISQLKGS